MFSPNCSLKRHLQCRARHRSLGKECQRGWEPRMWLGERCVTRCFRGVGLFGNAAQSRWYTSSKAKYQRETDSAKVPWGKDAKNFEKRVKEDLKPLRGKRRKRVWCACSRSGLRTGLHRAHTRPPRVLHSCKGRASILGVWIWMSAERRDPRKGEGGGKMAFFDPSWNTDQGV